jgi:SCP-2 sterol transfer family protein
VTSITQDLIEIAYKRLLEQLPALTTLKLVARLELRGRGDVQVFRVSAPGPEITKEEPDDARIEISLPRADFNDLADADISHWQAAYEHGVVKIGGDPAVLRLLGGVIAKHEARGKLKRVR